MRTFIAFSFVVMLALTTEVCTAQPESNDATAFERAEALITPQHLLQHIQELSSDAYTGRAPGTEGETKSVAYIIAQCRAMGLQPGTPDGGWTQKVTLWGMLSDGTLSL
jgi:hypothetical protein